MDLRAIFEKKGVPASVAFSEGFDTRFFRSRSYPRLFLMVAHESKSKDELPSTANYVVYPLAKGLLYNRYFPGQTNEPMIFKISYNFIPIEPADNDGSHMMRYQSGETGKEIFLYKGGAEKAFLDLAWIASKHKPGDSIPSTPFWPSPLDMFNDWLFEYAVFGPLDPAANPDSDPLAGLDKEYFHSQLASFDFGTLATIFAGSADQPLYLQKGSDAENRVYLSQEKTEKPQEKHIFSFLNPLEAVAKLKFFGFKSVEGNYFNSWDDQNLMFSIWNGQNIQVIPPPHGAGLVYKEKEQANSFLALDLK